MRRSVLRSEDVQREPIAAVHHVGEFVGHEAIRLEVDDVDFPLGVLPDPVEIAFGAAFGGVEGHHTRVVVVRAVHRPRAEAEHQPHDARLGIDALVPDVRVAREGHAGDLGKEQVAVAAAGNPLHQERHLLVLVQQPPLGTVAEGLFAHRAGVDRLHGREKILQSLPLRSLVRAEHALIFAREGVAVVVLQQAAASGR